MRYLMPRNSGAASSIEMIRGRCSAAEYAAFLARVDGVIVATHPAWHAGLALAAIRAGKHVLVEKPLALDLASCELVMDVAEQSGVCFDVAHVHLWATHFAPKRDPGVAHATYHTHERDYSAWLDWGPHVLSLMAWSDPDATTDELRMRVLVSQVPSDQPRRIHAGGDDWNYDSRMQAVKTPIFNMLSSFRRGLTHNINLNRRIYRALFAKERDGSKD
jgi:hypothetical protein